MGKVKRAIFSECYFGIDALKLKIDKIKHKNAKKAGMSKVLLKF